jgi:hypothetical protein
MAGNAVSVFGSSAILDYSIKKTAPKRASVSGGFTLISFRRPCLFSVSLLHGWSERLQVLSDVSTGVVEIYFCFSLFDAGKSHPPSQRETQQTPVAPALHRC